MLILIVTVVTSLSACQLDELFSSNNVEPTPEPPGGNVEEPTPTRIALVSGNNQTDTISATLDDPYVVRVTDAEGDPVEGVSVSWAAVGESDGSITPAAVETNAQGTASARHKLGSTTGPHSVTASVSGLQGSPVTFTSTASNGRPSRLAFAVQPSDAEQNADIKPAVVVVVQDRGGHLVKGATNRISLAIAPLSGTPLATLSGSLAESAVDGEATFSDLGINLIGSGYRLRATSAGLSAATSSAFDISLRPSPPPTASRLALISGNAQSDTIQATLTAPYVVRVTDTGGNPIQGIEVTWSLASAADGTIEPARSVTDVLGRASAVHTLGTKTGAVSASASVGGLDGSPVVFAAIATHGNPARLNFVRQPSDTRRDRDIRPPVQVEAVDRVGNPVTNAALNVTMSIVPLTGTPLAQLGGRLTEVTSDGVATFDRLRINLIGIGYRLNASAGGLSVISAPFNITLGD